MTNKHVRAAVGDKHMYKARGYQLLGLLYSISALLWFILPIIGAVYLACWVCTFLFHS